jgi:hypothetical protein
MLNRTLVLLATAVFILSSAVVPTSTQTGGAAGLTAAEQQAGWKLLFDGKSLNGWRGYKKTGAEGLRWRVVDGNMALPPAGGKDTLGALDVITTDTYGDFELQWEWKISPGGNSGVKYFVLEDMDAAIGHEYQIIDDANHPDAKLRDNRRTAGLYDALAAPSAKAKPVGEYNSSRVVVRGKHVEHWLNGDKVLEYELESPALQKAKAESKFKDIARWGTKVRGHLLFQDHGDQVWYRNIKVRNLDAAATSSARD